MASRIVYHDAINSSPICPHVANYQSNSTRSYDGVIMDDERCFTSNMNLSVQDQSIDLQT